MDSLPPFTITPALKGAADIKIKELNRVKESFKRRYHLNARLSAETSAVKRVSELLEDIKKFDSYLENDDDLSIMTRYIEQAHDDKSISEAKLLRFEEQLWNKLNKHLNRMEVSMLHVDLMKEVIEAESATESAAAKLKKAALEDDFEMVENELEELLERFEKETFTAKEVDVNTIETYLSDVIAGGRGETALECLRTDMRLYGEQLMDGRTEADQDGLMWVIMDLLKNDLISVEKKKILESYLQSPIALRELVATINMKSFRHWVYNNEHEGLPVTARQNSDGEYCITVEEDVIDMLFLHCTAIGWASKLKECLVEYARNSMAFASKFITPDEMNKREFFLMPTRRPIKPRASTCTCCHPSYPHAPMPPPAGMPLQYGSSPVVIIDVPGKKSKKKRSFDMHPPPPPPPAHDNLSHERSRVYTSDFFVSRLPSQEGCTPKLTRKEEVQAKLIKTLAIEAKLGKAFGGGAHVSTMSFDSVASSLPHKTIVTVLKFLGVPVLFVDFFTRFLEAKLNIGPALHGTPDRILKRARGVPVGHGLELFFSEAVLFFLELAVYQTTGSHLYRLRDTCFFVGSPKQKSGCTEQISKFATIMGMALKDIDTSSGKLAIGCLSMDTPSASPTAPACFIIDNSAVDVYSHHVKKQLSMCTTVLDWIRIWNSSVGTYAAHLFGPLAEIFGKSHLEAVKDAYNRIFSTVLGGNDLTAHIRYLLRSRSKVSVYDENLALEAFIYLPQAYGGLGVRNPFITMNLAHKINENPDANIEKYLKDEEIYYNFAAESFTVLSDEQRQEKIRTIFNDNKDRIDAALGPERDLTKFMSQEELTANREYIPYPVLRSSPRPAPQVNVFTPTVMDLYRDLHREPIDDIELSSQVFQSISFLAGIGDMKYMRKLSSEEKWVLGMHGAECFEKYGTLEIWWGEGVPREVYKAVRGHVWNDGDDDSSYGTFSDC
ncbi:hypothetical protein BKA66DRAFT_441064 [Pyrenochaeta sp. MPI-SDFR-AT-0127]|nr:hypothetical protein BKA66DRAFT_441064 [Pyrenochaeta sp. MPI-SDFR-AT-0127]